MTATLTPVPTSGQARINAKRNERAEFWRTVKVRVSAEMEPYFQRTLHLLGRGTRIDGRRQEVAWFAVELDVHIPSAPADAVRAEPVYYSDWNGDHPVPRLDYVVFHDAAGRVINSPNA